MKKKPTQPTQDLEDLEAHLAGTLRPVHPSDELTRRLKDRIRVPRRSQIVSRLSDWRSLYLTLGGVLSGVLIIITLARTLYFLVGRRAD